MVPGAGGAGYVVAMRERVGVLGLHGGVWVRVGWSVQKRGNPMQRKGLEDNRGREEKNILREFWQLYVLRDGRDFSCVAFCDYVVEMVLESFFVGCELGYALGEVDG